MPLQLSRIDYTALKPRQQENFNYQKFSAVLADFGFVTMRLSDDWQGADFVALHVSGEVLKVQLKGRVWFDKKYVDKGLFIAFPYEKDWYLYPHDELLAIASTEMTFSKTKYWNEKGVRHVKRLTKQLRRMLEPYKIPSDLQAVVGHAS
jgi:hypothetical protein